MTSISKEWAPPTGDYQIDADEFVCGFSWFHKKDTSVDIDASAVAFDEQGQLVDACYYNNLNILGGGIIHRGDSKGQEGVEEVEFNIAALEAAKVRCVVVLASCYKSSNLVHCTGINVNFKRYVKMVGNTFHTLSVNDLDTGYDTGNLLFMLYKDDQRWYIRRVVKPVKARSFDSCTLVMHNLIKEVYHPDTLMDYIASNDKTSFNMKKGQYCFLPLSEVQKIRVGLGWKSAEEGDNKIDLDASTILLQDVDGDGDLDPIEYIYYKNKQSKHGGIQAAEDSTGGSGKDSEDKEVIKINLAQIPRDVDAIAICVSIFKGAESFTNVEGAYVRLFSPEGHEYLKFKLDSSNLNKQSVVFAMLSKQNRNKRSKKIKKGWNVIALGHPADGQTAPEIRTNLWDTEGQFDSETSETVSNNLVAEVKKDGPISVDPSKLPPTPGPSPSKNSKTPTKNPVHSDRESQVRADIIGFSTKSPVKMRGSDPNSSDACCTIM